MVLHLKLTLLMCAAAVAQRYLSGSGRFAVQEAWIAARCQRAHVTGNGASQQRLVEEWRRELVAAMDGQGADGISVDGAGSAHPRHR